YLSGVWGGKDSLDGLGLGTLEIGKLGNWDIRVWDLINDLRTFVWHKVMVILTLSNLITSYNLLINFTLLSRGGQPHRHRLPPKVKTNNIVSHPVSKARPTSSTPPLSP